MRTQNRVSLEDYLMSIRDKDDFLEMYEALKEEITAFRNLLVDFGPNILGEFGEDLRIGDIKTIKYDRYSNKLEQSFMIVFNDGKEFTLTFSSIDVLYCHLVDVLKVHDILLKRLEEKTKHQRELIVKVNERFTPILFTKIVGKEDEGGSLQEEL